MTIVIIEDENLNTEQLLFYIHKYDPTITVAGLLKSNKEVVDWFSKNHSDFNLPATHIDSNTRSEYLSGQFVGLGYVHFANRAEMLDLFKDFEILELKEKIVTSQYPDKDSNQFASWTIVARKPI